MKKKADITRDRMFLGAFVNAYSRPVIEAKISLMAMRMYLKNLRPPLGFQTIYNTLTLRTESTHSEEIHLEAHM